MIFWHTTISDTTFDDYSTLLFPCGKTVRIFGKILSTYIHVHVHAGCREILGKCLRKFSEACNKARTIRQRFPSLQKAKFEFWPKQTDQSTMAAKASTARARVTNTLVIVFRKCCCYHGCVFIISSNFNISNGRFWFSGIVVIKNEILIDVFEKSVRLRVKFQVNVSHEMMMSLWLRAR